MMDRQLNLDDDQLLADFFRSNLRVEGKMYCHNTLRWLLCVAEHAKANPALGMDTFREMASRSPTWKDWTLITADQRARAEQRLPNVMKIILEKDMDLHNDRHLSDFLHDCLDEENKPSNHWTMLWLCSVAEHVADNPSLGMGTFYKLAMAPPGKRRWKLITGAQSERSWRGVSKILQ